MAWLGEYQRRRLQPSHLPADEKFRVGNKVRRRTDNYSWRVVQTHPGDWYDVESNVGPHLSQETFHGSNLIRG